MNLKLRLTAITLAVLLSLSLTTYLALNMNSFKEDYEETTIGDNDLSSSQSNNILQFTVDSTNFLNITVGNQVFTVDFGINDNYFWVPDQTYWQDAAPVRFNTTTNTDYIDVGQNFTIYEDNLYFGIIRSTHVGINGVNTKNYIDFGSCLGYRTAQLIAVVKYGHFSLGPAYTSGFAHSNDYLEQLVVEGQLQKNQFFINFLTKSYYFNNMYKVTLGGVNPEFSSFQFRNYKMIPNTYQIKALQFKVANLKYHIDYLTFDTSCSNTMQTSDSNSYYQIQNLYSQLNITDASQINQLPSIFIDLKDGQTISITPSEFFLTNYKFYGPDVYFRTDIVFQKALTLCSKYFLNHPILIDRENSILSITDQY